MISLVQVEYILALYEERNFQRAADRCFVTQPTLSVQIKKAEKQLGGRLFNRDVTPLETTPFFHKLLPVFHQLKSDMDSLKQRVSQDRDGIKEEIRIGVIPTIAHYLIPDMFGVLSERLADFSLKFEEHRTAELLELLEKRKLDIPAAEAIIQEITQEFTPDAQIDITVAADPNQDTFFETYATTNTSTSSESSWLESIEAPAALGDYLAQQIRLLSLPQNQELAMFFLAYSINDEGYLEDSVTDLAASLIQQVPSLDQDEAQELIELVLPILQNLLKLQP